MVSEVDGSLESMPVVDIAIFDWHAEAARGRREVCKDTSPRCPIGTSEACSMKHTHACQSAGAVADSASCCTCTVHAPHEADSTMARYADACGSEFALVSACLCERVLDGSEGGREGACGGGAGGRCRPIWRVLRVWPSHVDSGRGWASSGPWLGLLGTLPGAI